MSNLSLREQLLLGSIVAAVLAGAAVKHWRDARREKSAVVAASGVASRHPVASSRDEP